MLRDGGLWCHPPSMKPNPGTNAGPFGRQTEALGSGQGPGIPRSYCRLTGTFGFIPDTAGFRVCVVPKLVLVCWCGWIQGPGLV